LNKGEDGGVEGVELRGEEGELGGKRGKRTPAEPVLVLLARIADRDVALRLALCDFEGVAGDDDVGCVGAAWGWVSVCSVAMAAGGEGVRGTRRGIIRDVPDHFWLGRDGC